MVIDHMKNENLIRVCPACGFSFKTFDPKTGRKIKKCPMCGFELPDPDVFPKSPKDFNRKMV